MRTTPELVKGIIEVDVTVNLDPFILVANELVTELLADVGHTADRLELIERWLAAHFYTNLDPRAVTEKAGPVGQTVQSKVDLNLATSHYGQTAMMLDTSGTLADLNALKPTRKAQVFWLGKK